MKVRLSADYSSKGGDIYYPNNYILPGGYMFSYIDYYGEILDAEAGEMLQVGAGWPVCKRTVRGALSGTR